MKNGRPRLTSTELVKLKVAMEMMRPRDILYETIKSEMKRRGRWKTKPRGRPGWPSKAVQNEDFFS